MFYKHWKKLALTLTGLFWASCDFGSSSTEDAALYGCPPEGCPQDSPDSSDSNLSSSDKSSSSKTAGQSSNSQKNDSSSSVEPKSSSSFDMQVVPLYGVQLRDFSSSSMQKTSSSSEGEIIAPAYGVYDQVSCQDVSSDRQTLMREKDNGITMLQCENGVTCQEKITENWVSEYECIDDICPDYGVVKISEKMYACDDGNVYNEAEFLSRYYKKSNVIDKDSLDAPIAVYGPPCYFDGTCRDDIEK